MTTKRADEVTVGETIIECDKERVVAKVETYPNYVRIEYSRSEVRCLMLGEGVTVKN